MPGLCKLLELLLMFFQNPNLHVKVWVGQDTFRLIIKGTVPARVVVKYYQKFTIAFYLFLNN